MIAIVDSGGANISSVLFALERLGARAELTSDADKICGAERVILPGVGAAGAAMHKLRALGLVDILSRLEQPVLGVCLGMQLLFETSEEGETPMLGLLPGTVQHFTPAPGRTVPHMGWNSVDTRGDHPLLKDLPQESYFYFVHSYAAPCGDYTIGACDYGGDFSAIVAQHNFMGCQFHPERSGSVGAQILKNFLEVQI
jgi:glutamine amidotransferase